MMLGISCYHMPNLPIKLGQVDMITESTNIILFVRKKLVTVDIESLRIWMSNYMKFLQDSIEEVILMKMVSMILPLKNIQILKDTKELKSSEETGNFTVDFLLL